MDKNKIIEQLKKQKPQIDPEKLAAVRAKFAKLREKAKEKGEK